MALIFESTMIVQKKLSGKDYFWGNSLFLKKVGAMDWNVSPPRVEALTLVIVFGDKVFREVGKWDEFAKVKP